MSDQPVGPGEVVRRADASAPLGRWLREGARTVMFRRPRIENLCARPATLLLLLALLVFTGVALDRWAVDGPVHFDGSALASGWLTTLLALGACWVVARSRVDAVNLPEQAISTATLFGLLLAQQWVVSVPFGFAYATAPRWEPLSLAGVDAWAEGIWIVSMVWVALASTVLLWRYALPRGFAREAVVLQAALSVLLPMWAPPAAYWVVDEPPASSIAAEKPSFMPTQALLESQARALPEALAALQPGRPGIVDLYAITFAPYADADVFSREAGLVSDLMRTRFDAQHRVVQLQNHVRTAADVPWATPLNLQRTIQRIAGLMNRDEDILFIHLTSHGARDGRLAASFDPLAVDEVTPQQLVGWLDDAGVRYRVISISACFSGSWIEPLSGPGTLVMTAADATHTSYGCGRKSKLTFFGRAMYDEQLRSTHSFEAAYAAVRPVIEQREKEAGKTDGYSNPQISVGRAIRGPLLTLQQRLDAMPP